MEKLYLVYVDAYTEDYGTSVQLVGIYNDENLATKAIANVERENPSYEVMIKTIELNKQYPVFCWFIESMYCKDDEEFDKKSKLDKK